MFFQKGEKSKAGAAHACVSTLMPAATAAALTMMAGCANLSRPHANNGTLLDRSNVAAPRYDSAENRAYEYASCLQFGAEPEQKKAIKGMTRLLCSRRPDASPGMAVATQSLIHALHTDRYASPIRERAARALAEAKDANARHALINALGTVRDRRVRKEAAASLGKMRSSESVRYLEHTLLSDSDKTVRGEAAKSLAKIGDESCLPTLLSAARNDTDSYVRWRAKQALGRWLTPTDCEMMMSDYRYRLPRTFRFGASRLPTASLDPLPNPAEVHFRSEPVYKPDSRAGGAAQESDGERPPVPSGLVAESSPGLGPF